LSELFRAFLAIELAREARETLALAASELRSVAPKGTRFVPPEDVHLTIKFLGQLSEEVTPQLLRGVLPRLATTEPFEVEVGGFGAFPNARAARVLWLGITDGGVPLARLARRIEAAAARVGIARERRPYRGHLTLARLRQPATVPIDRIEAPPPVRFPVREVILFRSDLSPSGARYSPVARLPIGEGEVDLDVVSAHPKG
jgi:2'-5' RNA ligase